MKPLVYLGIDGVFTGSINVEHHEYHEVNQGQFALGYASAVYVEEGSGHHCRHV